MKSKFSEVEPSVIEEEIEKFEPDASDMRMMVRTNNVYDSFDEEEVSDNDISRMAIGIKSNFRKIWDKLIVFSIIYTIILLPYRMAFSIESNSSLLVALDVLVDFIFLIDLVLNFFFTYKNSTEIEIFTLKKIALTYLKTWFFVDLISSIPFSLISFFISESGNEASNFKAFARVARLYKMSKWMRVLRMFKIIKKKFSLTFDSEKTSKDKLIYGANLLFQFVIVLHSLSCFFIFIGFSNLETNWIVLNSLDELENLEIYIASMYFHMVSMFSIGYGDILIANLQERIYVCFFLCLGLVLYSLAISFISTYFTEKDKQMLMLRNKLNLLEEINKQYNLSDKFYQKIKKNVKDQFKRIVLERYKLLEELPTKYRNDLIYKMHYNHIQQLNFFKDQSHDFIIFVLPLMKPLKLVKNDILLTVGEFPEEMYLVTRGFLSLKVYSELGNIEVALIRKNYHFGEFYMHKSLQSPFMLENTKSNTEVLIFNKKNFNEARVNFNENINKLLFEGIRLIETIKKRTSLIDSLLEYTQDLEEIKTIIKDIDRYILKLGFKELFYEDSNFEDLKDQFLKQKYDEILEGLHIKSKTIKSIKSNSKSLHKSILNSLEKIDEEIYEMQENNAAQIGKKVESIKLKRSKSDKASKTSLRKKKRTETEKTSKSKSGFLRIIDAYSDNYDEMSPDDFTNNLENTLTVQNIQGKTRTSKEVMAIKLSDDISYFKNQNLISRSFNLPKNEMSIETHSVTISRQEGFTIRSTQAQQFRQKLEIQSTIQMQVGQMKSKPKMANSLEFGNLGYSLKMSYISSICSPTKEQLNSKVSNRWSSPEVDHMAKLMTEHNRESAFSQEFREFGENIEENLNNEKKVKLLVLDQRKRLGEGKREEREKIKPVRSISPLKVKSSFLNKKTKVKNYDQSSPSDLSGYELRKKRKTSKNKKNVSFVEFETKKSIKLLHKEKEELDLDKHKVLEKKLDLILERLKGMK